MKNIILTGDRPTGRLHLSHYVEAPESAGWSFRIPAASTRSTSSSPTIRP